jgi:hypothetical protein
MLIRRFRALLGAGWSTAFPQARSQRRAIEHAIALPCVLGRHTISRMLGALGRTACDWSADYKIFSRSRWDVGRLFDPVIDEYLKRYRSGPVKVALDDTKLKKTGKKIASAFWQRDPLSPPFHVNLVYGLRFLQAALLFPHYHEGDFPARAMPIRFQEAPVVKKPGKRASKEDREQYEKLKKQENLSTQALQLIRDLRAALDRRGGAERLLLIIADGSFANQTIFRAVLDRTQIVARCRKDAKLCFAAPAGARRKYDSQTFTPEQVRQQSDRAWQRVQIYLGGKRRFVKYKQVHDVLWRRGSGSQPRRLILLAPVPYKLSTHSRSNYRQPAYFLSTDLTTPVKELIEGCFDRWQIEVNHRDEKDLLGVGQAQVRNPQSVPRHPAFAVASYSLLLLAALQTFGPGRTADYPPLPKWRKADSKRPSILDIVSLLRSDCNEASVSPSAHLEIPFLPPNFAQNLVRHANT